jgi:hypothetical protein
MPEPWPAKTKMRVEMNSANAALRAPGWYTSWWLPTAILLIGILTVTHSSLSNLRGGRGRRRLRSERRGEGMHEMRW